jgi:hypothetical protein
MEECKGKKEGLIQSWNVCSHRVCMFAIRIIAYVISKLNSIPGAASWLALRVSYGMNGIVLKNQDLPSLAGYLL